MAEQILLSSVAFDGVREIGGFGQPLHTLYPQIRAVLASELGSGVADLLAEPVVDRLRGRIDWYSEGDPEQVPVVLLSDLPEVQQQPILEQIENQLVRGRELAERYATSGNQQRMQLAAMLKAVLGTPPASAVFLVNEHPVVTQWGFSADRPWQAAEGVSLQSALALPDNEGMPNITIPRWEAATLRGNANLPGGVTDADLRAVLGYTTADATDAQDTKTEPEAETLPVTPPSTAPSTPIPAVATALSQTPETAPATPSIADALEQSVVTDPPVTPAERTTAIPTPSLIQDSGPPATTVVDKSPSHIRYVVVGSRYFWAVAVLALLLSVAALLWRVTQSNNKLSVNDAAAQELLKAQQTEQVLRGHLEERIAALTARHSQCPAPTAATSTSETSVPATVSPASNPDAAPPGLEAALVSDAKPHTEQLDAPAPEPATSSNPSNAVTPQSASTTAPQTSTTATTDGTAASAVLTSPTAQERQEFTQRLSASGAASGEITATLFWDGGADLDLVVQCPSGEILDYLKSKGCGGTLDVDANSVRDQLSDKPVENVFWSAGKVLPGTYKIAVRYKPRKDERNPQPVSFQVRLIRDSQEQVFKGTVRPQQTVPVTQFTVRKS